MRDVAAIKDDPAARLERANGEIGRRFQWTWTPVVHLNAVKNSPELRKAYEAVLPEIVAFWLYRFEINIRASAILGAVGAGGVGEALVQSLNFRRYDRAGMLIIVIIVVTILIDTASGWLRRRILQGPGGAKPDTSSLEDRAHVSMAMAGSDGGAAGGGPD